MQLNQQTKLSNRNRFDSAIKINSLSKTVYQTRFIKLKMEYFVLYQVSGVESDGTYNTRGFYSGRARRPLDMYFDIESLQSCHQQST